MRVLPAVVFAVLLAAQLAPPALAKRNVQTLEPEFSRDQWAECFAVFTGMATLLLAQTDPAARQGPANRFLALSEEAALRWLDSQGPGQDRAVLMAGLGQAVDQVIKTAAARSDFSAYMQRTSERCIAAVSS